MFNHDEIQVKQHDFDIFLDLFLRATENIENHYFQLPVAQRENPVYRERVYCYELYHRIREKMPEGYPYKLDGELDKTGHPLIENSVGGVKPDFLVHERGRMDRNLAAIEVKPINATNYGIRKDMETLCGFLANAQYFRSIYLIYGNHNNHIERILQKVQKNFIAIPDQYLRQL
jgi:hypothetical protein